MLRNCAKTISCGEWLSYFRRMKIYSNVPKVLYSSFDKDLPYPNLPTPLRKAIPPDADILLDQLKKARSLNRLLELSSNHIDVMNGQHIVACLESVHSMRRDKYIDTKVLLQNEVFQSLCSRLMKVVRVLDPSDLISAYKVLSGLGVQNNSYVNQSLLKMIGGHLNDLDLDQLTFLSFLLSKQKHNAMVDGLKLALPLVLQIQIEQQLDSDNISQAVECLSLACRSRLKPVIIQKIIDVILEKAKSLSSNNAATIVFSLLNLETPMDGYKQLLNYSFEILAKNIELMEAKSILPILRHCRSRSVYHGPFFYAVSENIMAKNWKFEDMFEAVRRLVKLNFCPPNLMDYYVERIITEADTFSSTEHYSVLESVELLTTTGYHPKNLHDVLMVLCSNERKIEQLTSKSNNLFIKFVSHLAMLGHFPEKYLSIILNEELLFDGWSISRKQGRSRDFEQNILSLAWSLKVYDQEERFSLPPAFFKKIIQDIFELYSGTECPLQKFIENGLGGSQFLQNKVFSQDGIFIDHIVAMRSGNYPVSLQDAQNGNLALDRKFIEDITLPSDAKIVAVLLAHEDKYCQDPEVLKGVMELKIQLLRKRNYAPVVINYKTWSNLPDREKIPYLMYEIKLAAQQENVEKNSVL